MSGQLPLMPAIKRLMDEVMSGPATAEDDDGPLAAERRLALAAKKLTLFASGSATQKYMTTIQDQQEVMGALADMAIESYAIESCVLRARKVVERSGESAASLAIALTQAYCADAFDRIEAAARRVIANVAEGDMLRTQLAIVRRLAKREAWDTIALRQQIAQRVLDAGRYVTA